MKRWLIVLLALALLGGAAFTLRWMLYNGIIIPTAFSAGRYPVRGVDVSSYQGEIDWETLAKEDIQFAFLKATEGSGFEDPFFQANIHGASQTDLRIGAYHFFSFESPGQTQADNFISVVPKLEHMLPPVIDVELYASNLHAMPSREVVKPELVDLLSRLEAHYGMKPILYATEHSYTLYLEGDYQEYDIWIRNVLKKPKLSDGRSWTFWQYTSKERLPGYVGKETFIDMNVFSGSPEDFALYPPAP